MWIHAHVTIRNCAAKTAGPAESAARYVRSVKTANSTKVPTSVSILKRRPHWIKTRKTHVTELGSISVSTVLPVAESIEVTAIKSAACRTNKEDVMKRSVLNLVVLAILALTISGLMSGCKKGDVKPEVVKIDFAYYN